ncbi:hypothetical protein [Campylobacter armoricus]|uniref:hypothetical protein n=1 Tax=Campylobacter armoricus TaxID=2505970 RepID=UPI001116D37E|nr:hypothetical protein [Campylobacter armoricus]
MNKLLKERRIIIFGNLLCIFILVFCTCINWSNLSRLIPAWIVISILEIILIITYFNNKKSIKNYRNNIELYKDLAND